MDKLKKKKNAAMPTKLESKYLWFMYYSCAVDTFYDKLSLTRLERTTVFTHDGRKVTDERTQYKQVLICDVIQYRSVM